MKMNKGHVWGIALFLAGFLSAAYFQYTDTVPGVAFFIPFGTLLTREQDPTTFSNWIWGHVALGVAGLVIFGVSFFGSKNHHKTVGEITDGASGGKAAKVEENS